MSAIESFGVCPSVGSAEPRRTTHEADVREVQRGGSLPFEKDAGKVETALRRRVCATVLRQAENCPGTAIVKAAAELSSLVGFLARYP